LVSHASTRRSDAALMSCALIVVDVQRGFADPSWGRRNNPSCEENVAALIDAWRSRGEPIVFVRHDSVLPDSPLAPGQPGNAFQDVVSGEPDLLVTKTVNSAFLGEPDLGAWLRAGGVEEIAVAGIQTNMCCETTARMGGNLGFGVRFVIDATHTFDLPALDGSVLAADDLARVTAANLHGEFATVVQTRELL
jgi:nicotinamidase-related amidase